MSPSILLTDDDREMRYALSETLSRCGYTIDTASSGDEAVSKFSSKSFDMVISDIRMVHGDGMHVLREIKKHSPDTPIVLITAYGTIDNAVDAMKLGAFDYIIKPFSIESLEEVVKKGIDTALDSKKPATDGKRPVSEFISNDSKVLRLLNTAKQIALSDVTVLIEGESGTGKEMLAKFIHNKSHRADGPFVAINCAAIPDGLLESELFGYERGAFTGAINKRSGKFVLASSGTILLDEVGEMSLPLQAKLLRVLQERHVDTIGGREPVFINIRVIATTNKSLKKEVEDGRFREDLYYRLNVFPMTLPPLRERKGDIPLLVDYFLKKHQQGERRGNKMTVTKVSEDAVAALLNHEWKGNIRELENVVERAILMVDGDTLLAGHIMIEVRGSGQKTPATLAAGLSVHEMEKALILKTLEEVDWNRTKAAKLLNIGVRTLRNKLKEYREDGLFI
ncbi:MAG: sigma-54-dependent Fis family transcriptional regulator [Nitrospirae bacterium]|nr:sigma-54-dependent Fis family transcriptional regulator [Nitrospirota bacterium]